MARAYAVDFRERVLASHRAGTPVREIASLLQVSVRTIRRWEQLEREQGSVVPKAIPGRPRAIDIGQEPALRAQVASHPDATISEHCALWATTHARRVGRATMCRSLQRLPLPLKKRA